MMVLSAPSPDAASASALAATAFETVSLEALAVWLDAKLLGDASLPVGAIVHPRLAQQPSDMIYAPEAPALEALRLGPSRVALVDASVTIPEDLLEQGYGFLLSARSRYALALLTQRFDKPAAVAGNVPKAGGVHATAVVDPSATLHPSVRIGPYCVVGANTTIAAHTVLHAHCVVGADCHIAEHGVLHAGVRLGDRVTLGRRVIIQFNACIGSDGFSYVTPEVSRHEAAKQSGELVSEANPALESNPIERINSLGTVVLEDGVEVGACSCIDRGTLAETRIKAGTKLDNLVQVGHNNQVGRDCLIVSQVGLAGSCKVGDRVVIAGQAGLADHITIGDDAIIMAKSGVMNTVAPKEVVGGLPALPRRQALEQLAHISRLKGLYQDMKALKKQVASLEAELSALTDKDSDAETGSEG